MAIFLLSLHFLKNKILLLLWEFHTMQVDYVCSFPQVLLKPSIVIQFHAFPLSAESTCASQLLVGWGLPGMCFLSRRSCNNLNQDSPLPAAIKCPQLLSQGWSACVPCWVGFLSGLSLCMCCLSHCALTCICPVVLGKHGYCLSSFIFPAIKHYCLVSCFQSFDLDGVRSNTCQWVVACGHATPSPGNLESPLSP